MNKKGFIATSLIYSFFLIFITLFLTIIADYLQNKVLLNTIEKGIKEELNNGMGCSDFEAGDRLVFQGNSFGNSLPDGININGEVLYNVTDLECSNNTITIINVKDNSDTYNIVFNEFNFTKEPSDSEYYTITGVTTSE